jgi:hypothetical protein
LIRSFNEDDALLKPVTATTTNGHDNPPPRHLPAASFPGGLFSLRPAQEQ